MGSRLEIKVSTEDEGTLAVLECHGSLDTYTFEDLDMQIDKLFSEGCYRILVDLLHVVRISSAGAGVLVASLKIAQQNGGSLAVVAISKELLEVFDLLGLSNVLNLVPQRSDAYAVLRAD